MTLEFSQADHQAMRTCIKNAEKKTSAEIFAVLAHQSDDYRFVGMFFISFWIFAVSVLLSIWLLWNGYNISLIQFTIAQLLAFVVGYFSMLLIPSLASNSTPRIIKHKRARANGINQFLAHGIHHTKNRTGILIFISLEERYAEILVDTAIEEVIGKEFWLAEVEKLIEYCSKEKVIDGYIETINETGKALSKPFPRGRKKLNQLEDKLIII